jgi:thymidylate kinase
MNLARPTRGCADGRGVYVALCGPDGAGKTSLSAQLAAWADLHFNGVVRLHWRPGVLPRLGALAGREDPDPSRPHQASPSDLALSVVRLLYYWLDQLLGYGATIARRRRAGALVLLERGYWDMAVDPRRYRIQTPGSLVYILGRLLPQPDLTVVLVAEPHVLARRKDELPEQEIGRQLAAWRQLAGRRGWATVSVAQPLEQVARDIQQLILSVRADGHGAA